jgi:diaminopimelate epimerase
VAVPFVKIQGAGNDYIYLDGIGGSLPPGEPADWARRLSDRHFGVGGDGLILVLPGEAAPFRMRMFNADGSEGDMCGNGMRGFAKYVLEQGYSDAAAFDVETGAGIIRPHAERGPDGRVHRVRVDMGAPRLQRGQVPMAGGDPDAQVREEPLPLPDGRAIPVTALSMGNPHAVVFLQRPPTDADVLGDGPALERHGAFPRRTNVEFIQVLSRGELRMRVWERGSGETLACGTGACAALVAAALTGRTGRAATVHLQGGDLEVAWAEDGHVYLTGPTVEVFRGAYDPK